MSITRKYKVYYQRQSDMIVTWIFVDAKHEAEAIIIANDLLKGENIMYAGKL